MENMVAEQVLIPDADGVIYIKGQESLAHQYNLKAQLLELAQGEVNGLKERLRGVASAAAKTAGAGVRRVMLLGLRGTAVSVQVTDPEKAGNRNQIGKAEMEELIKLGGLATLGVSPEAVFERVGEEPPRIILTGTWYQWFDENILAKGSVQEQFMGKNKGVEVLPADQGTLKLSVTGVQKLREILTAGAESAKTIAAFLLDAGIKAFTVKADYGEK